MDMNGRQTNCKPNRSPPFRATQLWNEAVSMLQCGMPTRRHFSRMRYYDGCFSGKEAVDWLSRSLINNPRFGSNVTTEGTRKLLQHFLKTGVFRSVKGSLTFKDRGLYEFIDRTICSPSRKQERKHLLSQSAPGLKERDPNIPPGLRQRLAHGLTGKHQSHLRSPSPPGRPSAPPSDHNVSWKDFILKRIQTTLPSLGVELLINTDDLQSDWVMFNMCPGFDTMRRKTEFPFWVFTSITTVIKPQEKESEYTTYTGFEKDVYAVVKDYLRHRSCPMVPYNLYELIMYTFNHLHYMDLEMKNRDRDQDSVENLVLSMSQDWNDENTVHLDNLTKTVLPPNSCFETAFTSDEPITRIVPQSSVDTICLPMRKSVRTLSTANLDKSNIFKSRDDLNRYSLLKEGSMKEPEPVCKKFKSRRKIGDLRRTQSMAQMDADIKYSTLPLPSRPKVVKPSAPAQQPQSYINFGLSQSMDDLLAVEDAVDLDFEEAMQSVNCLLRASRGPQPAPSCSSSLESLSTVNTCHVSKASLVCIDSCLWYEDIQEKARLVFQAMVMLMPPVTRTSLRMLLQFIDQLPVPTDSAITKTEMVYDLSAHILSPGPRSKNVYSHHMVLSVVYFLVDNCRHIFQDIPDQGLLHSDEGRAQENKPVEVGKVFCERLTRNQFTDQGVTSSWLALAELLEQIITDTKMKSKEKKKRLKKFKEAYPHIYKQRFGGSCSNLASATHYR